MPDQTPRRLFRALDQFRIELPSWGFADTGTRFGKFFQPAAASTVEEKFHDAGLVHRLTGCCPTVAVHVLWDFARQATAEGKAGRLSGGRKTPSPQPSPGGRGGKTLAWDVKTPMQLARKHGIRIGSINPNIFQDQCYKLGSFCSPDPRTRQRALEHALECIAIGKAVGSNLLSMWLADGTNYPGQDNIYRRKHDLARALAAIHEALPRNMTMLVEYKPFEPGFYHTDVADWGMSYAFCRAAGPRAKVLVDTGHHLLGANIEHVVAFLLDEGMLGGFHFNDRKYADDDLTLGSIDPYAAFRIFDQIAQYEFERGRGAGAGTPSPQPSPGGRGGKAADSGIAYMVDQSHNLKPKLEAMVQTVMTAQELFATAQMVDRKALAMAQKKGDIVGAEMVLRRAFAADVRDLLCEYRLARGLPPDPLDELRASGIINRLGKERTAARKARGVVQAASYA